MSITSCAVSLENRSPFKLIHAHSHITGQGSNPPAEIAAGQSAAWKSSTDLLEGGTDGWSRYQVIGGDGTWFGNVQVSWNVPLVGDNDYNIHGPNKQSDSGHNGGCGTSVRFVFAGTVGNFKVAVFPQGSVELGEVATGLVPATRNGVSAVSRAADKLDVFVAGTDGGVRAAAWEPGDTAFRGWWSVAGGISLPGATVSAVSRSADKLDRRGRPRRALAGAWAERHSGCVLCR
jgi:hypothetical protein